MNYLKTRKRYFIGQIKKIISKEHNVVGVFIFRENKMRYFFKIRNGGFQRALVSPELKWSNELPLDDLSWLQAKTAVYNLSLIKEEMAEQKINEYIKSPLFKIKSLIGCSKL